MIRKNIYLPIIDEQFQGMLTRFYGEEKEYKQITFQVTEDCCLACTYCYQHNKSKNKMNFETAKKFIDNLFQDKYEYINRFNTQALVLDFIGGEPLMEIELIDKIIDYYFTEGIKKNHPWIFHTQISICSNGMLYFSQSFQNFLHKYSTITGFSISIDGNKELHDMCRIDLNRNGSYDMAMKAAQHYKNTWGNGQLSTKMTISPQNLPYIYNSIIDLIDKGYTQIWCNCVFENVWSILDAKKEYEELIKIADFILDNNLYDKVFVRFFEEQMGQPMDPITENDNYCGGCISDKTAAISINYEGKFFPCIRYMTSSLGENQKPLSFGSIEGIGITKDEQESIKQLSNITRRSQSTDECFFCSVASECGQCSAFNYEVNGTPNIRTTFLCDMHKARALANVYYWNKLYNKLNIDKTFKLNLSKEESIKYISSQEYDYLYKISNKGE